MDYVLLLELQTENFAFNYRVGWSLRKCIYLGVTIALKKVKIIKDDLNYETLIHQGLVLVGNC